LVPTYVGQQVIGSGSHTVTAEQGINDAQDAGMLAGNAGLSEGSVIYLDIENGGQMPSNQVEYVRSWITDVQNNTPYVPGVYCHKTTAPQVASAVDGVVTDLKTWVFGGPIDTGPHDIDLDAEQAPDPATSGYPAALLWQYRMSMNGDINLSWTDRNTGDILRLAKVDLDTATIEDPAHP